MSVCIVLGQTADDSQVLIDGHEITTAVRGVEVRAFVGELSLITLTLTAPVHIMGNVAPLFKGPEDLAECLNCKRWEKTFGAMDEVCPACGFTPRQRHYQECIKIGNAIVDSIVDKDTP